MKNYSSVKGTCPLFIALERNYIFPERDSLKTSRYFEINIAAVKFKIKLARSMFSNVWYIDYQNKLKCEKKNSSSCEYKYV